MPSGEAWMARALELAARARGRTSPNPLVGAVLVRDGEVVGEGFHARAGEPHAEVVALRAAGERARGADLYVTLEPCCHQGRTPPCTEALREAGVRRVFAATLDEDPRVAGQGVAALRAAGIEVQVGLLEQEARELNRAFLFAVRAGRPYVIVKYAMTLDGRVATTAGHARWVTGEPARRRVHELRDEVDAILVGVGTVIADDPQLTTRLADRPGRDPVRVVLDSHARIPPTARVLRVASRAPTWLAVTPELPAEGRRRLQQLRAGEAGRAPLDVLEVPARRGRVDLAALLRELGRRQIRSLLVEGGPTVHGAFFEEGAVEEVWVFVAPKLVGGAAAPGPLAGRGRARMDEAVPLRIVRTETLGEDWLFVARPAARDGTGGA